MARIRNYKCKVYTLVWKEISRRLAIDLAQIVAYFLYFLYFCICGICDIAFLFLPLIAYEQRQNLSTNASDTQQQLTLALGATATSL